MIRPKVLAYLISLGCVGIASLLQLGIRCFFGVHTPFLAFFPAIMFSSVSGGWGPGLFTVALTLLTAFSLQLTDPVRLMLFCPVAVLVVWGSARLREQSRLAAVATGRVEAALLEATRVRMEAEVLADVGVALIEYSDPGSAFRRLVNLTVPRLADWAAIDALDRDGVLQRVAVVHPDPEQVALGHLVNQLYPVDMNAKAGRPQVLRSGLTEWVREITDEMMVRFAIDERHLEMMRRLNLQSYICVPLQAGPRTLGTLTVCYAESCRRYSQRDVFLMEELGRRAGMCLENARLKEEAGRLLEAERSARAEAERASRLKDEFLATLSHELRTPLNAILGWVHIARSLELEPLEYCQALDTIERNARIQTKIIEDLLDMNRILSGKIHLDRQHNIDLVPVIQAGLEAVETAAAPKELSIQCQLPLEARLDGDAARLQQVVMNLLSNAIKFTPEHGQIHLRLLQDADRLVLEVEDTGQGISPEFLPHIFERFRQQDGSTTRRYGGLGLGLTIAKQIVLLHGGELQAFSQGEGRGSRFTVTLPGCPTAEAEVNPTDKPAVDLHKVRVLLVEDDADSRIFVERVLKERGAEVFSADCAQAALEILTEMRPTLLISDIGMPDKDGYQLIREIRLELGAVDLPALALTAFARPEDRQAALEAGFQSHLAKPVNPMDLLAAVQSLAQSGEPNVPLAACAERSGLGHRS